MNLIFAVTVGAASAIAPASLPGHYRAVTESQWHLKLTLKKDGSAVYTVSSWEPGEADTTTKKETLKARWKVEGATLVVELPDWGKDKRVVYESTSCLSYEEFGDKGCSPGLKPTSSNTPTNYSLGHQSLWRSKGFKPSWR